MYAKPLLHPLDVAVATAICCEVYVNDHPVVTGTPLCGTSICEDSRNCTVNVPVSDIVNG